MTDQNHELDRQPCENCQYLHDAMYGDYHLHCTPHPYGPPKEFCADWKKNNDIIPLRAEIACFPLSVLAETEAFILQKQRESIKTRKKLLALVIWVKVVFVLFGIFYCVTG